MAHINEDQIKILYASHRGFPWGGISTDTEQLLSSTLAKRVQLHFVETSPSKRPMAQSGRFDVFNLLASFAAVRNFLSAVKEVDPDVIHISSAFGLSFLKHSLMVLGSKSCKKTVILQPHCSISTLFTSKKAFLSRIWNKYVLFIIKKCDLLVVLSKEWLSIQDAIGNCKIRYIPNGIDLSPYRNLEMTRSSYHDPVTILFLGRIGKPKGVLDLLEAIKILRVKSKKAFQIRLFGEPASGIDIEIINKTISSYGLSDLISLSGPVYGQLKMDVWATADIFVLPSHHEGMPIVIIEAMASGLPVVATKVGGIPDTVIDGETGLLVMPENPGQLADVLLQLIDNPEQGLRMGSRGCTEAQERFDIDKKASLLYDCYIDAFTKHNTVAAVFSSR